MYKHIVLLLLAMSSSMHAILTYEDYIELEKKLTKQRETILLLLQDDHQENLSVLPHDVRKHIASFMIYSEPWGIIQKVDKK